jgi:hypothetical protein
LVQHARDRLETLQRHYYAKAARGEGGASPELLRRLDYALKGLPRVPSRRTMLAAGIGIALLFLFVGSRADAPPLRFALGLLDSLLVRSPNELTSVLQSARPAILLGLFLQVIGPIALILFVFASAFTLKRLILNLRVSNVSQLRNQPTKPQTSQATGVYETERAVFLAAGRSIPRENPVDLFPGAFLAVVTSWFAIFSLFVSFHNGLSTPRYPWVPRVANMALVYLTTLFLLIPGVYVLNSVNTFRARHELKQLFPIAAPKWVGLIVAGTLALPLVLNVVFLPVLPAAFIPAWVVLFIALVCGTFYSIVTLATVTLATSKMIRFTLLLYLSQVVAIVMVALTNRTGLPEASLFLIGVGVILVPLVALGLDRYGGNVRSAKSGPNTEFLEVRTLTLMLFGLAGAFFGGAFLRESALVGPLMLAIYVGYLSGSILLPGRLMWRWLFYVFLILISEIIVQVYLVAPKITKGEKIECWVFLAVVLSATAHWYLRKAWPMRTAVVSGPGKTPSMKTSHPPSKPSRSRHLQSPGVEFTERRKGAKPPGTS